MSVITKGRIFANGEQLTAEKLNVLVDEASFNSGTAVDNSTTRVNSNGAITVRPQGITSTELALGAVTKAKIENVANMKVLGNTSGSAAAPQEVAILDEDDMTSDSATAIATQQSIKAYTDTRALDPARGYNNLSHNTASGTIIENTTGRPLFVSFTLYSNNDINYLLLEISPNSNMTGGTRIAQTRIVSDNADPSGGQVCGIIPDGWYWKVSYSGSTLGEKVHCSFAL
jgi:hypothetical protein